MLFMSIQYAFVVYMVGLPTHINRTSLSSVYFALPFLQLGNIFSFLCCKIDQPRPRTGESGFAKTLVCTPLYNIYSDPM